MKRIIFLLFSVLSIGFEGFTQEGFQVNGRLIDTLGNPIARATVGVYIAGGKDTLKALSNNVGFFLIKGIPQRKFVLSISSLGYGTKLKAYTIAEGEEVLKLDSIKLLPEYSNLQEIVISTPPIIVKEDTVEYKADSFRLKPNAMVEDLLKKMPGIEVKNLDFHINNYELLTSVYGVRIDGIIGYSFLRRYIVHLDFDKRQMEVYTPGRFKYPRGGQLLKPNFSTLPLLQASVEDSKSFLNRFIKIYPNELAKNYD
jgi:hypothetical protein